MSSILLIGCGNLGKFYYQSILKHLGQTDLKIYTVDPFSKLPHNSNPTTTTHVHFDQLDQLVIPNNQVDLAIVTTCSDVRYQLTKQVLDSLTIKYLILEKILFQNEEEYQIIDQLLKEHKVTAWVNCPRRTYQYYRNLKQELNQQSIQIDQLTVTGVNWGLACNIMHFLDLYVYLTGDQDFTLEINDQLQLHPSKRKNFYEFEGMIKTTDGKLSISCQIDPDQSSFVLQKIFKLSDGTEIKINNLARQLEITDKNATQYYQVPYISDLMGLHIKDILTTGRSKLTDYRESMKIHLKLITLLKSQFKRHQIDNCPVT